MHRLSHYREFIVCMGASDNCSTNISELLHISNVKDAYRASNQVNFMRQVRVHNNRHTALDYIQQTLQCLALQGWHDKDSTATLNLIRAAEKQRYTRHAQRNRILAGESELLFRPELSHLQTYQLSRICALSPTCKRISISQAATLFNIPTLSTQIRYFLYRIWGHDAVSLLWGAGEDFKYEV